MTTNLLVTGPPRSGKTTVNERVRERLDKDGHKLLQLRVARSSGSSYLPTDPSMHEEIRCDRP